MRASRERVMAQLDKLLADIDKLRTTPRQLTREELDRWGELIRQRDRKQGQLNRIDYQY